MCGCPGKKAEVEGVTEIGVMRKRNEADYLAGVVAGSGTGAAAGAVVAGLVSVSTKLARSIPAGMVGRYSVPRWPHAVTVRARHVTDNPIANMAATLFTIWLIFFMIAL